MPPPTPSLLSILIATAVILSIDGCGKKNSSAPAAPATSSTSANTTPGTQEAASINSVSLSLLDVKIDKNPAGRPTLKGRASNPTTQNINVAEAAFKLFDKNGKEIGEVKTSVNNLRAGFSWNFEVEIPQKDAASAELIGFSTK